MTIKGGETSVSFNDHTKGHVVATEDYLHCL